MTFKNWDYEKWDQARQYCLKLKDHKLKNRSLVYIANSLVKIADPPMKASKEQKEIVSFANRLFSDLMKYDCFSNIRAIPLMGTALIQNKCENNREFVRGIALRCIKDFHKSPVNACYALFYLAQAGYEGESRIEFNKVLKKLKKMDGKHRIHQYNVLLSLLDKLIWKKEYDEVLNLTIESLKATEWGRERDKAINTLLNHHNKMNQKMIAELVGMLHEKEEQSDAWFTLTLKLFNDKKYEEALKLIPAIINAPHFSLRRFIEGLKNQQEISWLIEEIWRKNIRIGKVGFP